MTYLRDYANNVSLALSAKQDAGSTGNTAGSSVDGLQISNQMHAVQYVGTLNGNSPTITGKIQESSDGSTWSDVADGAFSAVTTSGNLAIINFNRTLRYLRYYSTIAGTGNLTVPMFALIGGQKKQV